MDQILDFGSLRRMRYEYPKGERRIDMSTKRDEAIRYLSWYFKLLFDSSGICWDESNDADIECIIDLIIDASKEV